MPHGEDCFTVQSYENVLISLLNGDSVVEVVSAILHRVENIQGPLVDFMPIFVNYGLISSQNIFLFIQDHSKKLKAMVKGLKTQNTLWMLLYQEKVNKSKPEHSQKSANPEPDRLYHLYSQFNNILSTKASEDPAKQYKHLNRILANMEHFLSATLSSTDKNFVSYFFKCEELLNSLSDPNFPIYDAIDVLDQSVLGLFTNRNRPLADEASSENESFVDFEVPGVSKNENPSLTANLSEISSSVESAPDDFMHGLSSLQEILIVRDARQDSDTTLLGVRGDLNSEEWRGNVLEVYTEIKKVTQIISAWTEEHRGNLHTIENVLDLFEAHSKRSKEIFYANTKELRTEMDKRSTTKIAIEVRILETKKFHKRYERNCQNRLRKLKRKLKIIKRSIPTKGTKLSQTLKPVRDHILLLLEKSNSSPAIVDMLEIFDSELAPFMRQFE